MRFGPLYSIYAPYKVIKWSAAAALCCNKEVYEEERNKQWSAGMKLFEVFGEALPQVITNNLIVTTVDL